MKPKPFASLNHLTVPVAIYPTTAVLEVLGSAAPEEPLGHRTEARPRRSSSSATARGATARSASAWSTPAAGRTGASAQEVHYLPQHAQSSSPSGLLTVPRCRLGSCCVTAPDRTRLVLSLGRLRLLLCASARLALRPWPLPPWPEQHAP